jgi:hypothetical protein
MIGPIKLLAAAGFLAASASLAGAAPASPSTALINSGIAAATTMDNVIQVHGRHRRCRNGIAGWHRHKWVRGDRRRIRCRPWHERRRHSYERDCIKIGNFIRICPED